MNVFLKLPPLASIFAISVVVSLISTLIYKFTTNQKLMKEIKDDIKRLQAEAKADPAKAGHLQKEMMKSMHKQFSASMKSTLIFFVPAILIFTWMGSHLAYEPISVGDEFTSTMKFTPGVAGQALLSAEGGLQLLSNQTLAVGNGAVVWRLKAIEGGTHKLAYSFGDELYSLSVLVTDEYKYENPVLARKKGLKENSAIERISVDLKSVNPFGDLSIAGWKPGWLATYLVFSLALSMVLRKLLKLH